MTLQLLNFPQSANYYNLMVLCFSRLKAEFYKLRLDELSICSLFHQALLERGKWI